MRNLKLSILTVFIATVLSTGTAEASEPGNLFRSPEEKKNFARDMSTLIENGWRKWQDKVVVDNIYVDGSRGVLLPGDMRGDVLTIATILDGFDRSGRSQDYIDCVRAVAGAVENGMRFWQRGYTNKNIPFPQGASCVYTLPPCYNIPVMLATGSSEGAQAMKEGSLYNYMLYRVPYMDEDISIVFKGTASAISECFARWQQTCCIKGILAEGGVAPQPAPMGRGPGLVKGAKGNNGKLDGPYFDGTVMYKRMCEYFDNCGEETVAKAGN